MTAIAQGYTFMTRWSSAKETRLANATSACDDILIWGIGRPVRKSPELDDRQVSGRDLKVGESSSSEGEIRDFASSVQKLPRDVIIAVNGKIVAGLEYDGLAIPGCE